MQKAKDHEEIRGKSDRAWSKRLSQGNVSREIEWMIQAIFLH